MWLLKIITYMDSLYKVFMLKPSKKNYLVIKTITLTIPDKSFS